MKTVQVWEQNKSLALQVAVASDFGARLKGLMFRKSLTAEEGLLLLDCSAIHCCFMRFPIDVVYLDGKMNVLGKETVKPWHLGSIFKGTENVLELKAGAAEELAAGMKLSLKEA